jgi:hypothetical protein
MQKLLVIFLFPLSVFATDVTKDTTIAGTWNLHGKVLNIYGKISGKGTIQNAIINANEYTQIFDTTIRLDACRAREFCAMWYGAAPANKDNAKALQLSVDACVNQMDLFIPRGNYKFSKPLLIYNLSGNGYIGAQINIYGEADMFFDGTTLTYTGLSASAIGFQYAKGGSFHNIKLQGQFVPPSNKGVAYYNLAYNQFNDVTKRCAAGYNGIAIDYDGKLNSGGSTGLAIHDVWITGFDVLISISPNGKTYNADVLSFTNIRLGNGRCGIQSGQAQEKGNIINNVVAWDNLHTLMSIGNAGKYQGGNYVINGGNIAGSCVRLFNINERGWFSLYVNGLYAESFGQIGTILTGDGLYNPPVSLANCNFDFAYPSQAGIQTLLNTNSNFIRLSNCMLRYYGETSDTLHFSGNATYENCSFSGPVKSGPGTVFINYPASDAPHK